MAAYEQILLRVPPRLKGQIKAIVGRLNAKRPPGVPALTMTTFILGAVTHALGREVK
jgi:hypothetical protein